MNEYLIDPKKRYFFLRMRTALTPTPIFVPYGTYLGTHSKVYIQRGGQWWARYVVLDESSRG